MNKGYATKFLALAVCFFSFASAAVAQSFTLIPGNTMNVTVRADSFINPFIDATNNLSSELTLDYELVSNNMNSAWGVQVCDNVNCYVTPIQSGTMNPIRPGVTELVFKINLNPANTPGTGSISYAVWDQNDMSSIDTVTFNFDVTAPLVSVEEEALAAQIKLAPQPVDDVLSVFLPESFGRGDAQIYSLNGALVAEHAVSGTQAELDLTTLTPGMYILRLSNGKAVVNKRIAVQ